MWTVGCVAFLQMAFAAPLTVFEKNPWRVIDYDFARDKVQRGRRALPLGGRFGFDHDATFARRLHVLPEASARIT